jgi:hypothetical protein
MDITLNDLIEPRHELGSVDLTVQDSDIQHFERSNRLKKGVDPAKFGEIRQRWLGKGAKVSIATSDTKSIKIKGDKVYEHVLLPLICTFAPEAGTHFTDAQLDLRLRTAANVAAAIAKEMFPEEIAEQSHVSRDLKLSPKFSLAKVKVELGSIGDKKKYILYEPHITALHLGTSRPAWSFRSTTGKSLNGVKNLFLVVRKLAGSDVNAHINVSGRIQTDLGFIPIGWAAKDDVVQMSVKI